MKMKRISKGNKYRWGKRPYGMLILTVTIAISLLVVALPSACFNRSEKQTNNNSQKENSIEADYGSADTNLNILATPSNKRLLGTGSKPPLISYQDTINVNSLGIFGDGKTDVTNAINRALSIASKKEAALYFPKGKYIISKQGIILKYSNTGLIGEPNGNTIFAPGSKDVDALIRSDTKIKDIHNIVIKQVVFQCQNKEFSSNFALLFYSGLNNLLISDCQFEDVYKTYIRLNDVSKISILKSRFSNEGKIQPNSHFIVVLGAKDIVVSGNSFTGYYQAVNVIPRDQQTATGVSVKDNYFDGMWYLQPASLSGEGNSVTYTADCLKSEKLDFIKVSNNFSNTAKGVAMWKIVRILYPKSYGKASISSHSLRDDKASFLSDSIIPGEIVEFGDYRGIIDSVLSNAKLKIEYWYHKKTLDRVNLQNKFVDYTLYKIYLGKAQSYTPHKLHIKYFYDLNGKRIIPHDGTRFELINTVPVYAIHFSKNTSDVYIIGNKIFRNYADQIGFYGANALIKDNYIKDGQDMGITVTNYNNKGSIVKDNYIVRQGSCGIFVNGRGNTIEDNTIMGPLPFANFLNESSMVMSGIRLKDGVNNVITNNNINLGKGNGIGGGITIFNKVKIENKVISNKIDNVPEGKKIHIFKNN